MFQHFFYAPIATVRVAYQQLILNVGIRKEQKKRFNVVLCVVGAENIGLGATSIYGRGDYIVIRGV